MGPIIALLVGPMLLQLTNPSRTFFIFVFASVSAFIISLYLPELKHIPFDFTFRFNIIPSSFNLLTFLCSFFVQGILIVNIGKLLNSPNISLIALITMAGIYLAYRRICIVFISALGGIFADKFGLNNVYLTALFFTLAGLFLIAVGFTKTGIITAFTFNSINTALAPGNGIMSESNHLKIIAENSTWNDMGAAIGSLVASSLLLSTYFNSIFFIETFVLLGAIIFHIKTTNF